MAEFRATAGAVLVEQTAVTAEFRATTVAILIEQTPAVVGFVKVGGNVTVSFDSVDLTPYINQARLEATLSQFDHTDFGSGAMERIPTQTLWAFPLGGMWDVGLDNQVGRRVGSEGVLEIIFHTITYTWTTALLVDYQITSEVTAGIVWMAAVTGVGAPTRSS